MDLFTVGDFHQNDALKDGCIDHVAAADYDLVLLVGDYEDAGYYEELVAGLDTPFIALTGNWDFGFEPPENEEYEKLYNYIQADLFGYRIVMLGAVYPDNFQEETVSFLREVDQEKRIIASHYPPHMLGDLARTGTRAGFPEFRDLIMQAKPALWTCGHIHEDFGRFSLMQTTVLNASAQESGKGWAVTMDDDGIAETSEVVLVDDA